jgi:toxin FitB
MVLLDSNILSEVLRPQINTGVSQWFAQQTVLAMSVVCLHEVLYGLQRKRMVGVLARFEHLVKLAEIIPVTEDIARQAAALRADFSMRGIARDAADMHIAATAIVRECTLATRNTKDFAGCGLRLVNPFSDV